jgi:hypothetical protein
MAERISVKLTPLDLTYLSESRREQATTPQLFEVFQELASNSDFQNVALGFMYFEREKALIEKPEDVELCNSYIMQFENLIRGGKPEFGFDYRFFAEFFPIKEITRIFYRLSKREYVSPSTGFTCFKFHKDKFRTIDDGIEIGYNCLARLGKAACLFLQSREQDTTELSERVDRYDECKRIASGKAGCFLSYLGEE